MKKLVFLIAVVFITSCGNKVESQQTECDSFSVENQKGKCAQAITQDEEGVGDTTDIDDSPSYKTVSKASEADIITFNADGTFIAKNVSGGDDEKYVYNVIVKILKENQLCNMSTMVTKYVGNKEIGGATSFFKGHWTVKSQIYNGGTKDFYVLKAKNEQGDEFNMKVRVKFNECYSMEPLPHIVFKVSQLEMGKY